MKGDELSRTEKANKNRILPDMFGVSEELMKSGRYRDRRSV